MSSPIVSSPAAHVPPRLHARVLPCSRAQAQLEADGIDLAEAGRKLSSTIPTIISMPFNLEWPAFLLQGAVKELTERIGNAAPSPAQLSMRRQDTRGVVSRDGSFWETGSKDNSFKAGSAPSSANMQPSPSIRPRGPSLDAALGDSDMGATGTAAMERRREAPTW